MALPQRQNDYEQDDNSGLSAVERAEKRWGMHPGETDDEQNSPTEDPGTAEDDAGKSARHRADKRWGMESEQDTNNKSTGEKTTNSEDEANSSSLFNETEEKSRSKKLVGKLATRRNGVIAGILGLSVGGLATFTILSGPLQFIHIAQQLQLFHFSPQEDASDDRTTKIARYIRHGGDTKKTRMNALGNAFADKIESRLNKTGIESSYNKAAYGDGYIIDPAKIPAESEIGKFRDKSPQQIKEHFKKTYGIDLEIKANGVLFADAKNFSSKNYRNMTKAMLREAGYSKATAAIRARILSKRAGVSWHPIKKLDKNILQSVAARRAKFQEDRQKRIDTGDSGVDTRQQSEGKNDDGSDKPPSDESNRTKADADKLTAEAKAAAAETKTGVKAADGPNAKLKAEVDVKIKALKVAGGVSAAIGLICLIRGIADEVDNMKHAKVVLPLMRLGMEAITVGNQVMTGQDIDMEQLGFLSEQLSNDETGSWAAARSIKAELGEDLTGAPDILEEAKIQTDSNVVSRFINSIPGAKGVCRAAGTWVGQAVTFAIDILSGPISAIGSTAISVVAGPKLISGLAGWLSGHPIDLTVAGADYGNYINYGARLAANDSIIAGGGRELTDREVAQLDGISRENRLAELQSMSLATRIFDPYESSSLVSKAIDSETANLVRTGNIAALGTRLLNVTGSLGKGFAGIFTGRAHAATTTYEYGFREYGFSEKELNSDFVKNPFENAEVVSGLLEGPGGGTIVSRVKECFGITINTTELGGVGGVTSAQEVPEYKNIEKEKGCASSDDDWLRVRFFIFDTQLMEATACFEGDSEACATSGLPDTTPVGTNPGTTPGTTPTTPVSPGTCAAGTTKATGPNADGTFDGYVSGAKTPITLCSVDNLPVQAIDSDGDESTPGKKYYIPSSNGKALVESSKSADLANMVAKAIADKTPLTAISSFRTNEHQKAACGTVTNGKCANSGYALPGESRHQSGKAIDFLDSNRNSTANCRKPGRTVNGICQGTDAAWKWLNANAKQFNFFQLKHESWHWSADGS